MATIQIDRLLETTVRRGASDLHLAVGKPPTLRMHGHLRELQTKVLDPEDTVALMKSITPERIQDRKSTRLNSSHGYISYAVFCLKKKKKKKNKTKNIQKRQ